MTRDGQSDGSMTVDEIRAAIAEREPARNLQRGHVLVDYLLQRGSDDHASGLEAALIGDPNTLLQAKLGGPVPFWSVKARQFDLLLLLLQGLTAELEERKLCPLWTSGDPDFDRSVARALWQIAGTSNSGDVSDKPQAAVSAMAEVIARFTRIARNLQNREGGYRHAYAGELICESHDSLKLKRVGKENWIAFVRPLLDARTFERVGAEEFLDVAWQSLSLDQDDPNLLLYFKSADGWVDYNLRFGFGTLREAVVAGLERAARRAGLYAVFGTQPAETLNGVLYALEQGAKTAFDPRVRTRLHGILSSLGPIWPGYLEMRTEREILPVARAGLTNLGEALFPEFKDMPAFSKDVPFMETTLFEAIDAQLLEFVSGAGVSDVERRADFALAVSIFGSTFNAALADRFVALDNPPGRATELLRQFLKLNVTHWWTSVTRRASHMALSAFLGEKLRVRFSEMDPAFAASIGQYGLDAAKWDMARARLSALRGAAPPSEPALSAAQRGIQAWLDERLIVVALGLDEAGHAQFTRGAADFTAEGELLRFLAQFRLFRAPFLLKAHGTAEVSEADQAMHKAMAEGDGLPALANLLIWTALFAQLSQFGVDLVYGDEAEEEGEEELEDQEEDQEEEDEEHDDENEDVSEGENASWFEAAMAGGALGFCADLLFCETAGMKSVQLASLTEVDHPAIASSLRIWHQACVGEDVRAALAEWAKGQGAALDRLQVTRQALNYALLHQLQDMMSPGYLRRTVKDMQSRAAEAHWRMPGARDPSDRGGA